ncbi:MAG: terpene cyclase/mutase family protein [Eubacterium sp.]|nr:terpene cyclase/mutase family protein [Eubacterium sp.]
MMRVKNVCAKLYKGVAMIVLCMVLLCAFTFVPVSAASTQSQVTSAISKCRSYVQNKYSTPDYGSEFLVIAQARSGLSLSNSYFSTYYNNVANYLAYTDGVLSTGATRSEYSRTILALTSIGVDATDVAGYNLFDHLSSLSEITKQGMNGAVWALLAINCHTSYQTTDRVALAEELITYLLGKEISGGGWAYSGSTPDGDMTAMTIQALAPYYEEDGYEEVTQAIDRGLVILSESQQDNGGYISCGAENAESASQVITALSALSIDADTDSRFIKNNKSVVDNLLTYQKSSGGFLHVKSNSLVNQLATTQAYYALVSYNRNVNSQSFLYDMSEMTLAAGAAGDGKTHTGEEEDSDSDDDDDSDSSDKKKSKTKKKKTSDSDSDSEKSSSDSSSSSSSSSTSSTSVSSKKSTDSSKEEEEDIDDEEEDDWGFEPQEYVESDSEVVAVADANETDAKETSQTSEINRTPWVIGGCVVAAAVVAFSLVSILKGKRK